MKPTVFIADDNPADLTLLDLAFSESGVEANLITASDGMEAIERLKSIQPDLILLDIKMPRADGFEVLRWVRSETRLTDVPVIIMSSSNASNDHVQALALGALRLWSKPTKFEEVIAFVTGIPSYFRKS